MIQEPTGLINICKLPGMSSHDVVYRVRRITGVKRVGHAGTLDPIACGVLPICVGRAARLSDYIADESKTYRAEIVFGLTTESGDSEGEVTVRADAGHITEADIAAVLPRFTGVIRQRPPTRSAVWIGGVRAYDLVRRGHEVEMPEREVTVFAFTPVRLLPGQHPRLLADITCSKGTFIRTLAIDLGEALGVGGMLSFLARTAVGDCRLNDAITTDELAAEAEAGRLAEWLRPPDAPLTHIPTLHLGAAGDIFRRGQRQPCDAAPDLYRVYGSDGFLGLGRVEEGILRTVVNLYSY